MNGDALIGILIPFFGTALGSGLVLLMKREFNFYTEDFLSALAAGVMTAAAVWSLIIPALEQSAPLGKRSALYVSLVISAGSLFMLCLEGLIDRKNGNTGIGSFLAVTIHNIPEGMAVGSAYAVASASESSVPYSAALVLALGIAVQNIPEGAVISLPLYARGYSKLRALISGVLSGTVEPLGALAALLMSRNVGTMLPWLLSFAAGTMLFVVGQDMLPGIKTKDRFPLAGMGFTLGFIIMMSLDVALS